jgi:asparagine synthase (glutamine-hydrolysing)
MCGVAAFIPIHGGRSPGDGSRAAVAAMVGPLNHRGPDEQQVVDLGGPVFGHARLSIIDLVTGTQPLYNEDRSVAVILNGEIYNYRELRRDLEARGHRFASHSDTEVIAHLYEDYGEGLFEHLNGMFAVLLWDARKERLVAGRDRLGEKPLLYCQTPQGLVIASELKSLLRFPGVPREIDQEALALYFASMYVPAPLSIFKAVRKLLPGHWLTFDRSGLTIRRYWHLDPVPSSMRSEAELAEEFRSLFTECVRMRTVADVPLGVFLSGGIDSSAVCAMLARDGTRIKTFTVGFHDEVDERPAARLVADRYATEHTELLVDANLADEFEHVYGYLDEPFGDSSVIPTHLIARAARQHVKVILTGDGGDELFAGYPMYVDQKYRRGSRLVSGLSKLANRASIGALGWDALAGHAGTSPRAFASWHDARSVFRDAEVQAIMRSPAASSIDFYRARSNGRRATDSLTTAFLYDIDFYLPDDLLKKVDMASMLASLECRAPFLDHRLVEWALTIPPGLKLRGDRTKDFLKRAMADLLPEAILQRPKQGFGAPIDTWLRRHLRTLALDLTAPGCRAEAFVTREAIDEARQMLETTGLNPDFRVSAKLWLLVVLEVWLRKYADGA